MEPCYWDRFVGSFNDFFLSSFVFCVENNGPYVGESIMLAKTWCVAISVVLAAAVVTVMISSFTPAAGDDPSKENVPKLDRAQREAIVAAANQAINKHLKAERKKETPGDIDAAFWGEAISKLKPIRVRNDLVNVAIVLSEKAGVEKGLYVSIPISSYAATVGDRFALMTKRSTKEDKSFGTLYQYRLQPKAK